ncbi:hypothetical protein SAMN06269185_2083 [Natronoarchaeum philippinense]|uniref:Uncharacterized protein n=1 Tax=Natronoarchaeum philippinense TaxID=558529 RepID=A0A285P011_NATPI|nr:hypothetical protein [Natronoarchaeum philippinense]SNZ13221.1 hypothetical protein SAMN06269185_2083 [Natronoarchaeum philippinense]
MTATSAQGTDKGIGIAVLCAVVAALGAMVMFVGAPDVTAAWGFAAAMVFGVLSVVGAHAYGA